MVTPPITVNPSSTTSALTTTAATTTSATTTGDTSTSGAPTTSVTLKARAPSAPADTTTTDAATTTSDTATTKSEKDLADGLPRTTTTERETITKSRKIAKQYYQKLHEINTLAEPNCGNPQLSNALRSQFLNTHNRLRGSLARGQTEKSKGWGTAPPARIIYRMKYNCDAESHAQQYVHTCQTGGLPEHTHPGYKVNRHVLNNPRATKEGAVQAAMTTWWSQLANNGIKSNMLFDSGEPKRGANNVLSWSKMAWWDNIYLGCSVKHCGSFFYTVCMYKPGGNRVNEHVYRVGRVCADCPAGQCDGDALCRW
ncbi:SCP-like protein [Ancylostoma caninum]|uniref:SCP-like protein n=1 Tax=Ancylostoma caninum TaxID=29170 RepID=A0A368GTY0_ANCCA|nr:SCP-like protein [Ancylostoma caninum]